MIFHRIGKIAVRPQLVAGHIACRSCKQARDPVYDGSAGMLYGGRLYYMEFCIRLVAYPPVAHIAVLGAVYLAYGLFLDGDALHGLYGHYCGHTDAVARLDGLAEGGAVYIVIYDIRHVLMVDGLDGKARFIADGFAGIPCIGGLKAQHDAVERAIMSIECCRKSPPACRRWRAACMPAYIWTIMIRIWSLQNCRLGLPLCHVHRRQF